MTLKKHVSTLALVSILGLTLANPGFSQTATDTDGDGVPDAAEALLGTDPMVADTDGDGPSDLADTDPAFMANPLDMTGAPAPFAIKEALVENNYDYAAKKDATDHLELLVTNSGSMDLSGFSIYYSMTDADTGKVEGTFRKLDGFSVPAGGEARIHFDDGTVAGHFRANPNSIYLTSQAAKAVSVVLKADGFAPVSVDVAKDKGGAEAAD
ncbi:MAG: hypothetical protein B7Z10_01480 [Rhodobacterales bacterium 32-66-7]|nr:MAG: hypothetical protein B7Z10_01480 [Rhodobacterales bacterium 32-66-7]